MSTLGKVLLVLNLLAAGGLAYLTAQDWSKRQEIQGGLLRYHLTLQGLPTEVQKGDATDTVPIEIKTPSGVTLQVARKKILDAHFSGATGGDIYGGGGTVTSLLEELQRVETKLLTLLNNQQGDAGKLAFLVGSINASGQFQPALLLRMAESFEERTALRSLAYPAPATPELLQKNAKEAENRLKVKLTALNGLPQPKAAATQAAAIEELKKAIEKNPKDEAAKAKLAAISTQQPPSTRDDNDRRRRIALFLMLLDPSAAWQKRTMTVTGLKTYHAALNEQVNRLTDIARQTERGIETDQVRFETQYDLLQSLALKLDLLVLEQTRIVAGLTEMEALDAASKATRATQLKGLNDQLSELRQSIAAVLGQQAVAEKAVFELQRKVGETLKGNLELETKLDQSEQKKP
jgi:hypothetical protein